MLDQSRPPMPKRLLVSFSFFAALALAHAAPLFDQPVPELHLTNGEVLHDAVAKSFNSTSVMVRYADGGRTVPYDLFPDEFKSLVLARKPIAHVSSSKTVAVTPKADVKKKTEDSASKLPGETFNGLTLTSFSAGPGSGYMQTEIYNDSAEKVQLAAGALQAELDNGKIVNGRHWIEVNDDGKIQNTLAATQDLPPRSATVLKASFPIPPGVTVTKVTWSQN